MVEHKGLKLPVKWHIPTSFCNHRMPELWRETGIIINLQNTSQLSIQREVFSFSVLGQTEDSGIELVNSGRILSVLSGGIAQAAVKNEKFNSVPWSGTGVGKCDLGATLPRQKRLKII